VQRRRTKFFAERNIVRKNENRIKTKMNTSERNKTRTIGAEKNENEIKMIVEKKRNKNKN